MNTENHFVIGWNTTKIESGFKFMVRTTQYQKESLTIISGVATTRPRAEGQAKKWVTYCKQMKASNPTATPEELKEIILASVKK